MLAISLAFVDVRTFFTLIGFCSKNFKLEDDQTIPYFNRMRRCQKSAYLFAEFTPNAEIYWATALSVLETIDPEQWSWRLRHSLFGVVGHTSVACFQFSFPSSRRS